MSILSLFLIGFAFCEVIFSSTTSEVNSKEDDPIRDDHQPAARSEISEQDYTPKGEEHRRMRDSVKNCKKSDKVYMGSSPEIFNDYQERINTSISRERIDVSMDRLDAEIEQWKKEYTDFDIQNILGYIIRKTRNGKASSEDRWSEYLIPTIQSGELVFFKSPNTPFQKGLSITLVTTGYIDHTFDFNQYSFALVIQYVAETDGQALFAPLSYSEKYTQETGRKRAWRTQKVGGLQIVLENILLPFNAI